MGVRSQPEGQACLDRGRLGLPDLLTVEEVAGWLKTTRDAVYKMAQRGQLPRAIRLGRRSLYRRDQLLCWLEERTCAVAGEEEER